MTLQMASQYLKELLALEREAESLKNQIGPSEMERSQKVLEELIQTRIDDLIGK